MYSQKSQKFMNVGMYTRQDKEIVPTGMTVRGKNLGKGTWNENV
jgi:hypothetical protein